MKVELITKHLFGSTTQLRIVDESKFLNQLRFSFLVESCEPAPDEKEAPETTADKPQQEPKKRKKEPNPKREVYFPENFPRLIIDLAPADNTCPRCAEEMTQKEGRADYRETLLQSRSSLCCAVSASCVCLQKL